MMANSALYVTINNHDIPVIAVKPIEASEFESLQEIKLLVAKQDLPLGIVTNAAWKKLESLYDAN